MDIDSSFTIGLSEEMWGEIQALLDELETPCSEPRGMALAWQLGEALQGYMGIDREILGASIYAEFLRKRRIESC